MEGHYDEITPGSRHDPPPVSAYPFPEFFFFLFSLLDYFTSKGFLIILKCVSNVFHISVN